MSSDEKQKEKARIRQSRRRERLGAEGWKHYNRFTPEKYHPELDIKLNELIENDRLLKEKVVSNPDIL